MKIYTKTGDQGQTSLYGQQRVPKNDRRIHLIGTLDELNSFVGLAISHLDDSIAKQMLRTQRQLFHLGAAVADLDLDVEKFVSRCNRWITALESEMDQMDQTLPKQTSFILPGGTTPSAIIHVARTVCRRAERNAVELFSVPQTDAETVAIKYLNRLSDWMFVTTRMLNFLGGIQEQEWDSDEDGV